MTTRVSSVLHNLLRLGLILILVSPRIFTISLTATLSFLWPRNSWNEFLPLIFVIALLIRSYMICIIRMMFVGMRASSGQVYCPLITRNKLSANICHHINSQLITISLKVREEFWNPSRSQSSPEHLHISFGRKEKIELNSVCANF